MIVPKSVALAASILLLLALEAECFNTQYYNTKKFPWGLEASPNIRHGEDARQLQTTEFVVISRDESSVVVSWDDAWEEDFFPSFDIEITGGGISRNFTSFDTEFGFVDLEPNTEYTVTVSTDAVNFNISETVETCPTFMFATSADIDTCITVSGYYKDASGEARSCSELSDAANVLACFEGGLSVQSFIVPEGSWRASLDSTVVLRCPRESFCQPGEQANDTEVLVPTDIYCTPDQSGTFCEECDTDAGFVPTESGCVECTTVDVNDYIAVIIGAVVFMALVLLFALYTAFESGYTIFETEASTIQEPEEEDDDRGDDLKNQNAAQHSNYYDWVQVIGVKLRIAASFFQVFFVYIILFRNQEYPEAFRIVFDIIRFLSNLDFTVIFDAFNFRCVYDYTYYEELVAIVSIPAAMILFLALITCGLYGACVRERELLPRSFISATMFILFLVYPMVSVSIFQVFVCVTIPGDTSQFLAIDYRIDCEADNRETWIIVAAVLVVIYPAGVLFYYSFCLGFYRGGLSFLSSPYRGSRYWFECYELVRKLILTSVIVLLQLLQSPNTTEILLLVTQNLLILSIVILMYFAPYKSHIDAWFAVLSLVLLIPVVQYSFLDPYGDTIQYGAEILCLVELVLFVLFVVLDFVKKAFFPSEPKHDDQLLDVSMMEEAKKDTNNYTVGVPQDRRSPQRNASSQELLTSAKHYAGIEEEKRQLALYKQENDALKKDVSILKAQSSANLMDEMELAKLESDVFKKEASIAEAELTLSKDELSLAKFENRIAESEVKLLEVEVEGLKKDLDLYKEETELQKNEIKYYEEEYAKLEGGNS